MVTFELREMIRSSATNRIEVIRTFPDYAERVAKIAYAEKATEFPKIYFELVRVDHAETLIDFTAHR